MTLRITAEASLDGKAAGQRTSRNPIGQRHASQRRRLAGASR